MPTDTGRRVVACYVGSGSSGLARFRRKEGIVIEVRGEVG